MIACDLEGESSGCSSGRFSEVLPGSTGERVMASVDLRRGWDRLMPGSLGSTKGTPRSESDTDLGILLQNVAQSNS